MAAPTITSLEPASGPTGGLTLVEVTGSGFRMPPAPPASGPTSPPRPTVEVLVGGRRAADVRVRAPDRLSFLSPAHDAGTADVVVRNLDDDGVPIAGEEATLAGGYTFVAPRLAVESDLTRLVRTLLRELKRQVHPNVSLTVQTDFDAETGDELHLTELASMPGLVLVGPGALREPLLLAQPGTRGPRAATGTALPQARPVHGGPRVHARRRRGPHDRAPEPHGGGGALLPPQQVPRDGPRPGEPALGRASATRWTSRRTATCG
jgi:hypothetical protein